MLELTLCECGDGEESILLHTARLSCRRLEHAQQGTHDLVGDLRGIFRGHLAQDALQGNNITYCQTSHPLYGKIIHFADSPIKSVMTFDHSQSFYIVYWSCHIILPQLTSNSSRFFLNFYSSYNHVTRQGEQRCRIFQACTFVLFVLPLLQRDLPFSGVLRI